MKASIVPIKMHLQLLILILALFVITSLFWFDTPLSLLLSRFRSPSWLITFSDLYDPSIIGIGSFVFFAFQYIFKGNNRDFGKHLFTIQLITSILVQTGKHLIGRVRPEYAIAHEVFTITGFSLKNSFHSFPSGHAANLTAMLVTFVIYNRLSLKAATLIILPFSFVRVLLLKHFLSDILFGIVIGVLVNYFFFFRKKKSDGESPPDLSTQKLKKELS